MSVLCWRCTAPEDRIVRDPNGTVNGTVNLTGDESRILELLTENPSCTYQDIASRLGVGRKFVSVQIKRLKEKGIIERIGSDKTGYWKITERKQ